MQRSAIMRAAAVLALLFGVPLLLAPNALLAMYKAPELNEPGVYQGMLSGAYLLGMGVANWLAAGLEARAARPVVVATFVMCALGLVVALVRQLQGLAPTLAWANVVIFAVLAVLYGLLLRPQAAAPVAATADA